MKNTIITKEEIKDTWFDVSITNRGVEGNTLCFRVYNDNLGEIVIGNCYYNEAPDYYPYAFNSLNGSASLTFSDGSTCDFLAILNICREDSEKGRLLLRC